MVEQVIEGPGTGPTGGACACAFQPDALTVFAQEGRVSSAQLGYCNCITPVEQPVNLERIGGAQGR